MRIAIDKNYPHLETVPLSKDIQLHGTQYAEGMILSPGHYSGLPEFYKIVTIVINTEKVAFVYKKLTSWYLEHFRFFELVEGIYTESHILDLEALNHHLPLVAYTVAGTNLVTPKVCLLY